MISKEKTKTQKTHRKSAITLGVLFIIGTAAGVIGGLVAGPIQDGPDYIIEIAASQTNFFV